MWHGRYIVFLFGKCQAKWQFFYIYAGTYQLTRSQRKPKQAYTRKKIGRNCNNSSLVSQLLYEYCMHKGHHFVGAFIFPGKCHVKRQFWQELIKLQENIVSQTFTIWIRRNLYVQGTWRNPAFLDFFVENNLRNANFWKEKKHCY